MSRFLFDDFDAGTVYAGSDVVQAADLPWCEHSAFAGVSLKHLLTGAQTDGAFSCHLVRIEPDCAIGKHAHLTQAELHEVAAGEGECLIAGKTLKYVPGVLAVIPCRIAHEVRAGKAGLLLLAKFVPPLC